MRNGQALKSRRKGGSEFKAAKWDLAGMEGSFAMIICSYGKLDGDFDGTTTPLKAGDIVSISRDTSVGSGSRRSERVSNDSVISEIN